jgi:nucleoside-diphosphate-sugar epimerase
MIVLVAGAGGRLGGLLVRSLVARGHAVRGLVRADEQAPAVEALGATPLVADLRGDVEWTAEGCDAAVFAARTRVLADLGTVDGGGAAKLAESADRFELQRFVLCSAVGADAPGRRQSPLREFLAAKRFAELRLERLDLPWTILRFGPMTEAPGSGRIRTTLDGPRPLTISRQDAAGTIVETLDRPQLARQVVNVVGGDRDIADALDDIEPAPLPSIQSSGLATGQVLNPPPNPDMLFADAAPLDAAVDYEGEGDPPPEVVDNDDPAPGVP